MTILEYLKTKQNSTIEELQELIRDCPEDEMPTKEELVGMMIEIASNVTKIYNRGFNDAIDIIQECDTNLLKRKLPPHII